MASKIVPTNIDGTFPVAGQDNSSQGFRDNFTNIKNNFTFARNEISDLQAKSILTGALEGSTLNNDMAGTQIVRPQLKAWTQSLIDLGAVSGSIVLDFTTGNFQKITTAGPIAFSLNNWPSSTGATAQGYGVMRVWFAVTDVTHYITLPASITIGINDIAGYNPTYNTITFDTPGNYVFDFSSVDGGTNYLIFDITRNRVQFRDPSFYFNEDVSPTFLIGFQDALPLAITLATGNDTLQLRGSQTNYGGVPDHGNQVGIGINSYNPLYAALGGNANVAGYSVATSRAYIDPLTGLPVIDVTALVQSNDYIGYMDFLGATLNPADLTDISINEFSAIRGFVNGISPYSPGGNLWIGTKSDYLGPGTGNLTVAMTIENDQSAYFYGNTTISGYTIMTKPIVDNGTIVKSFATVGDSFTSNNNVSTLIIDSTSSTTISQGNVYLPTDAVNNQTLTISAVAPITSANVYCSNTIPVKYVTSNTFASGNVRVHLTFYNNVWYRS